MLCEEGADNNERREANNPLNNEDISAYELYIFFLFYIKLFLQKCNFFYPRSPKGC